MSRKLLFSGWLRRSEPTMDDLNERRDGYVGAHRDARQADWKPAHTKAAARRRARLEHVRPEGERPDRRVEQTGALDLDGLDRALAAGGTS